MACDSTVRLRGCSRDMADAIGRNTFVRKVIVVEGNAEELNMEPMWRSPSLDAIVFPHDNRAPTIYLRPPQHKPSLE